MDEYIEREALIKLVETKHFTVVCDKGDAEAVRKSVQTQGKLFHEAIEECPAVDVVPKVELEAMRSAANSYKFHYEKAVADIKTLLDEMEFLIEQIYRVCGAEIQIYGKYAEIKKKYTEEE